MRGCGVLCLALASAFVASVSADINAEQGVCCEEDRDLGCFAPGGDFFNIPNRPLNSVPDCAIIPKLYLRLNTRTSPKFTQVLTPYAPSTITTSYFDPKKPTKVLMHGFLDRYTRPPWEAVKNALLKDGDYNVIRFDWSWANVPPYIQACANLRLAGAFLAKFLHVLVKTAGVDPKNIHLIGHSLGAHGSGYAGMLMRTQYNTTIGRITGLDPAGPYFTNMSASVRLDPTDAEFVDTIVSNGDALNAFGSPTAMGHMNFYPNGGINQVGCSAPITNQLLNTESILKSSPTREAAIAKARKYIKSTLWFDVPMTPFDKLGNMFDFVPNSLIGGIGQLVAPDSFDLVGCSHNRAVLIYANTVVKDDCKITGYLCDSYIHFLEDEGGCGECNNDTTCSRMGLYANQAMAEKKRTKNFYTVTTGATPFCLNFKVQFKLQAANPSIPENDRAEGSIYLTFSGSLGKTPKMLVSDPEFIPLTPGKSYSFYPVLPIDLGIMKSVTLNWKPKGGIFGMINLSTDYIFIDGDITTTDNDGVITVFTPSASKVRSLRDMVAPFTRQEEV